MLFCTADDPSGIGKSALVACTVRCGRDAGMRILNARGGELEQAFGYGVVRQLYAECAGMPTWA